MFWKIAWRSLAQRCASVVLTVSALTVSVTVLVGIEHLRQSARANFARTVSGTDLIAGARTGDINLLLYSVFRLGNASNTMSWHSYEQIAGLPDVAWTIPLALGDSHKGYKVLATSDDYFLHFRYGDDQPLLLAEGRPFQGSADVVLGADVARKLGYRLGDHLVLSHGAANTSFTLHDGHPFEVVGILAPTATPVDQTLHINLEGMEAVHSGHAKPAHHVHSAGGDHGESEGVDSEQPEQPGETGQKHHAATSLTAVMIGLHSRVKVFQVQRLINDYRGEPLQAILPGVTLVQLWSTLAIMENTLRAISWLVLIAAFFGMAAMLLASLRERRREILLLRTIGASPAFIALLLQLEVLLMTLLAVLLALGCTFAALAIGAQWWVAELGVRISPDLFHHGIGETLMMVLGGAVLIGFLPAIGAYRLSRGVPSGL